MKKLFKQKKGITLIALVITIIVLLIIAGISISMLTGDNGILQKATDAKTFSKRASVVEQARTDVLGYQAENQGGDLDKSQLKSVLDKYFDEDNFTTTGSNSNYSIKNIYDLAGNVFEWTMEIANTSEIVYRRRSI